MMLRPRHVGVALVLALAAFAPLAAAQEARLDGTGVVVAVPAADKLIVRMDDRVVPVRLVGVRAQSGGACLAREARERVRSLALGKQVVVVHEASQPADTAYVRRAGADVGWRLVRGGYAFVSYRTPFALLRSYRIAQRHARSDSAGRWSGSCAGLSVGIERDLSRVTIGNRIGYTISVANSRRLAQKDVTLTVRFSARVRIVAGELPCHATARAMTCTLGTLDGAVTRSFAGGPPHRGWRQLWFEVAPLAPGTLEAVVTARSAVRDANLDDNAARAVAAVARGPARADLAVNVRRGSNTSPWARGLLTFIVSVRNLGPSEATGVVLSDHSEGGDFGGIACHKFCVGGLRRSGPASLEVGAEETTYLQVAPRGADEVADVATVRAATPDPNGANNSASATAMPAPASAPAPDARLQLRIATSTRRLRLGQHGTVTVVVRNVGAGTAADVVLRDSFAYASSVLVEPHDPCSARGVCRLGSLNPGQEVTVPFDFVARHVGRSVLNYAYVTSSSFLGAASAQSRPIALVPAREPQRIVDAGRLGRLRVTASTSPQAAIDILGSPRAGSFFGEFCDLGWRGVAISFVGRVGRDACGAGAGGKVTRAVVRDRHWRTPRGLRVGASARELQRIYPAAQRRGHSYWLTARRREFGVLTPGLEAVVRRGRVVSLVIDVAGWLND